MPLFGPPGVKKLEAGKESNGSLRALQYHLDRPDQEKYEQLRQPACGALACIGLPAVEPLIAGLLLSGDRDQSMRRSNTSQVRETGKGSRLILRHRFCQSVRFVWIVKEIFQYSFLKNNYARFFNIPKFSSSRPAGKIFVPICFKNK